jgi:hypothetical protein
VTVSHEDITSSVISEGLKPGEQVVVDGAARLSDGSRISIVPAAVVPGAATPAAEAPRAPRPGQGSGQRRTGTPG